MPRIQKSIHKDFTVVHNGFLKDSELSLQARGLLVTMMSKPEFTNDGTPWNFTIRGLASELKEGKAAISSTLNELEERGYLMRDNITDEKGKFVDVLYTFSDEVMPEAIEKYKRKHPEKYPEYTIAPLSETPNPENPNPENRDTDNRDTENPNPENSDNNKIKKNKIQKEKIFSDKTSINQSFAETSVETVENSKSIDGLIEDYLQEQKVYTQIVKENIDYENYADWISRFVTDGSMSIRELDEIVAIIVRAICSRKKKDIICGQEFPHEVIKSALLKADRDCIENALDTMKKTDDIRNVEKYFISTLFNEVNNHNFKSNNESRWAEYAVKRDLGY